MRTDQIETPRTFDVYGMIIWTSSGLKEYIVSTAEYREWEYWELKLTVPPLSYYPKVHHELFPL